MGLLRLQKGSHSKEMDRSDEVSYAGSKEDPEFKEPGSLRKRGRKVDPIAALWHGLGQPWLLLVLGILALLLILGALVIPQVPPEFAFDLPATTRWLISTSAGYGAMGQLMLNIGLFDVLHSLLLRIVFGMIGLVLAIHLGDRLGILFYNLKVPGLLTKPTNAVEEPLISAAPNTLYQFRESLQSPLPSASTQLEAHLRSSFPHVKRLQFELPPSAMPSPTHSPVGVKKDQPEQQPLDASTPLLQERILAYSSLLPSYLRPLLMVGLLIALISLWLITTTGWELYPPPMAPGDQLTFDHQGLDIRYMAQLSQTPSVDDGTVDDGTVLNDTVIDSSGELPLERTLRVQVHEEMITLPLDPVQGSNGRVDKSGTVGIRVAQVDIKARPGPPGLLISTVDGNEDLALPDRSQQMSSVGLVFPGAGNEKAVLLLFQEARALRIVRSDAQAQISYVIQFLDRDANAIGDPQRIDGTQSAIIDLETVGKSLRFDPVPGVIVEARYLPGLWLMLIALSLSLIGAAGYWLDSGYVLLQLAPWPTERTIAIAQSDSRSEIAALEKLIAGN